jgi:hypothetical protein
MARFVRRANRQRGPVLADGEVYEQITTSVFDAFTYPIVRSICPIVVTSLECVHPDRYGRDRNRACTQSCRWTAMSSVAVVVPMGNSAPT